MAKVKLNGAAIKQAFVNNGEKIGLGVAVAIAGFLTVSAIQRSSKTRADSDSPAILAKSADDMQTVITKGGSGGPPAVPSAKTYDVQPLLTTVDASQIAAIEHQIPWQPPVKDQRPLRGEPALLTVLKLTAFSDHGDFPMKGIPGTAAAPVPAAPAPARGTRDPLGGAAPAAPAPAAPAGAPGEIHGGRRFNMITGLIPLAPQQSEFDALFANAQQPPIADAPAGEKRANPYRDVRYQGYAVERREIINGQPQAPVALSLVEMFTERKSWAFNAPEIVPDTYLISTEGGAPISFPLPPLAGRNWGANAAHPDIPLKNDKPIGPAPAAKPDPMKPGELDPFGEAAAKPVEAGPVAAAEEKDNGYRLYRFWDWNVDQGKTYQYRVQLVVLNPNYQVADRFLKNAASNKEKVLRSAWSDWSPATTVPRDHQMYLAGVEYVNQMKEAQATVTCVSWDNDRGIEFMSDLKLARGDFAMFEGEGKGTNPAGGAEIKDKNFKFEPRMLLLDYRGGKSSPDPKKTDNAAEAVFWDMTTNQAVVHRQAFDMVEIEAAKNRYKKSGAAPAPGQAMMGAAPNDPGLLLAPPSSGTTTPAKSRPK